MNVKKLILSTTVYIALSLFALSGCSNKEAEAKIATLQLENKELSIQVEMLRKSLDSLKDLSVEHQKNLGDLDL